MRRRRGGSPLLRGAVMGTGAYMMGSSAAKKSAAQAQQEAAQNAQIAELQQQVAQQQAAQAGQPGSSVSPERDPIALLKQLGELKTAGILTEEEFEAKKAQLLKQI
jgi:multidrug efflux pump subunit AcrA (membrane-fusion protein)